MKNKLLSIFGSTVAVVAIAFLVSPLVSLAGGLFFIDSDTGYAGFGNTTPAHRIDVSGAIYSRLVTASSSAINWDAGNVQQITLTSSPTLTFSNAQAGGKYDLILTQDGTGSRTVTWPASVIWSGGTAPTLSTVAGAIDTVSFIYNGANYLGNYALNYQVPSSPSSLLTSLVSYWKLDELSGNAADSNGSNTLTNNNSVAYSTAKIGNGVRLASTSSAYLSISDGSQSGLDLTNSVTVSAWVKFDSLPSSAGEARYIVSKKQDGTDPGGAYALSLYNHSGTNALYFELRGTNWVDVIQNWTPSLNTWYHVVGTWDGSNSIGRVYVNGSQLGSDTTSAETGLQTNAIGFKIGANQDSGGSPAKFQDGMIDEVGIWSRAVTSSEVTELYNSGSGNQYPF